MASEMQPLCLLVVLAFPCTLYAKTKTVLAKRTDSKGDEIT